MSPPKVGGDIIPDRRTPSEITQRVPDDWRVRQPYLMEHSGSLL